MPQLPHMAPCSCWSRIGFYWLLGAVLALLVILDVLALIRILADGASQSAIQSTFVLVGLVHDWNATWPLLRRGVRSKPPGFAGLLGCANFPPSTVCRISFLVLLSQHPQVERLPADSPTIHVRP